MNEALYIEFTIFFAYSMSDLTIKSGLLSRHSATVSFTSVLSKPSVKKRRTELASRGSVNIN